MENYIFLTLRHIYQDYDSSLLFKDKKKHCQTDSPCPYPRRWELLSHLEPVVEEVLGFFTTVKYNRVLQPASYLSESTKVLKIKIVNTALQKVIHMTVIKYMVAS